jgi:hypothetical protein
MPKHLAWHHEKFCIERHLLCKGPISQRKKGIWRHVLLRPSIGNVRGAIFGNFSQHKKLFQWILIVTRSFTYTETHLIPLQTACLLTSTFALGPIPYV